MKLYAKDNSKLERFLQIVKGFSGDIGMEFGLSKCAKATFKRSKLEKSDEKYLGAEEPSGIQHATMKQKLKKEFVRETRLIL